MMSSERKIRASRANGARSRGPVTPEGKRRASMNALRHGMLARCAVLENDSPEAFRAVVAQHIARLEPADGVELGIIEEMALAFWRMRRAWAVETRTLDHAVAAQPLGDEIGRIAAAFGDPEAGPRLALIQRYEARLHRMYQRALRNIQLLRNLKVPNEPNPISGHGITPLAASERR